MVFSIKSNILATLAYYDVFDFPLKKDEIFQRLFIFKHFFMEQNQQIRNESEFNSELEQLVKSGAIDLREDYYFLFGREYLAPLRLKREKTAESKMRKTFWAVGWLRFVPYLRAVFASGSLAMGNADELSDLDVLIVANSDRIWLTRLLMILILSILGIRRKASDKIAPDKICLNHFVTDGSLMIPFKSVYNAQTYANLIPLYARDINLTERFKKENNWVLDYVCEWGNGLENKKRLNPGLPGVIAKISEMILNNKLGDFFEKIARDCQSRKIAANPLTNQAGGRVVFNDKQLEFHPASPEEGIIKKYNERMIKFGLNEFAREKNSGLTQ